MAMTTVRGPPATRVAAMLAGSSTSAAIHARRLASRTLSTMAARCASGKNASGFARMTTRRAARASISASSVPRRSMARQRTRVSSVARKPSRRLVVVAGHDEARAAEEALVVGRQLADEARQAGRGVHHHGVRASRKSAVARGLHQLAHDVAGGR
ncbi:MAG: hypothetical protein U1F43_36650 [Myxococcota bacterium]